MSKNTAAKVETSPAVQQSSGLPVAGQSVAPPAQEVLASDFVTPKILIMQGLSELLKDRTKRLSQGDIVRSTTGEKLGDDKNPVEFIPLRYNSKWMLSEKV